MSATILYRELRTLLAAGCDAAGITEERRHLQGVVFTPPDPFVLPYVRETLISGAEYSTGNARVESAGIYQIDVSGPMNALTRTVTDAVDAIRSAFVPGRKSSRNGLDLCIDAASILAPDQDDRTFTIPISVAYRTWRTPSPRVT